MFQWNLTAKTILSVPDWIKFLKKIIIKAIITGLFHKMKKISKKDELDLYYSILRIRRIEEKLQKNMLTGKLDVQSIYLSVKKQLALH